MPFSVGDTVELVTYRLSRAGGERTPMAQGTIGRVCRVAPSGRAYRVQFVEPVGCRLIYEGSLQASDGEAPACSAECSV